MSKIWLTILYSFTVLQMAGQNYSASGRVYDSINKQNLHNASIALLDLKDSTLLQFSRTDIKGTFQFNGLKVGMYLLQVYYPQYAIFSEPFSVSQESGSVNLGILNLYTKIHILSEVIVKQRNSAIRFKNDTTEFIADSFVVRDGANVEELIKKLPGFSVDRKGVISSLGQVVRKVLVDGDEFFGNDPTIATRNLSASDIAKVQMYDAASDKSRLTGIDDGIKQKTVNLVLKDDAKRGYFGKMEVGSDLVKYYQWKLTANKFSPDSKRGLYFSGDRTGRNDMNFSEGQDYGNSIASFDGSNIRINTLIDEFSSSAAEGIPENLTGAFMINQKYGGNSKKNNTVNNLNFNQQHVNSERKRRSEYILPELSIYNSQVSSGITDRNRFAFSSNNEIVINNKSTLNITFKSEVSSISENAQQKGSFEDSVGNYFSSYDRSISGETKFTRYKSEIYWRRTFKKSGRLLSLNGGGGLYDGTVKGFLFNQTNNFKPNNSIVISLTDQKKDNKASAGGVQAILGFQEPISKNTNLQLNYFLLYTNNTQRIISYDKKNSAYLDINPDNSSDFAFETVQNRWGIIMNHTFQRASLRFGANIQSLNLKQKNIILDSLSTRHFFNFLPTVNYRTKIKKSGTLSLGYISSVQQPSFNQLQSFNNNNDPLNVFKGNQNLKPSNTHAFSSNLSYSNASVNSSISLITNLNFINNAFGLSHVVDSFGGRSITPINVDGNMSYGVTLSYFRPFNSNRLKIDFGPRFRHARIKNFINGVENTIVTDRISLGLKVDRKLGKLIETYLWYAPEYNFSKSSVNVLGNAKYFTHFVESNTRLDLPNGWYFSTIITVDIRPAISSVFTNTSVYLWDLSVEKRLSKKSDLWALFQVNDLLNSRKGVDRNISSNFYSESTYQTIQRYFLATLRWRFSKNKTINKND